MIDPLDRLQLEHARALSRRNRLVARATFWERWRGALLLPSVLIAGLLGWLLGGVLKHALGLPERTEAFAMVLAVAISGQSLHAFFNVRRLEAARHRVDVLEQRLRRGP